MRTNRGYLLNYFAIPTATGVVEGLNNKTKAISHRSCGFRTAATFILASYYGSGRLPEPQTVYRF